MDDATVEILINVREQGRQNLTEAQAGLDLLRRAVEAVSRAQRDGEPGIVAYRAGLKSIRDNAIEAGLGSEALKVATNQARTALEAYFAAIAGGLPIEAAQSAALGAVSGQFEANAAATTADTVAQRSFGAAMLANTGTMLAALNPWGNWWKVIIEVGLVLAPFVVQVVAATVIVSAFAIGATGMALALAGATGMFLTIGAAIVLLADKMGWINNSMATFKEHLRDVGSNLAKLASPAANQIVKFLDSLLPLAQGAGRDIIEWFSARLPLALTAMHSAINNLTPDVRSFASFLGAMFDKLNPQIPRMFEEIARFGIGALQGLIGNLVALGQWFQQRLPSYGPVIKDIFGGIGSAVQGLATNFGKLSDWFVKNWPSIKGNLDSFTSGFGEAFKNLNKSFGGPGSVDWTGFFKTLGEVAGGAAGIIGDAFRALGIIMSQVIAALPVAWQNIVAGFIGMVNGFIDGINGMLTAINNLPGPVKALLGLSGNIGLISPLEQPGLGGKANPQRGRSSGTQSVGDDGNVGASGGKGRSSGARIAVTINGVDTNNAGTVALTVSGTLRRLMQT